MCEKELFETMERVKRERDDKEKLAREVKSLREKFMHLEKENAMMAQRLA